VAAVADEAPTGRRLNVPHRRAGSALGQKLGHGQIAELIGSELENSWPSHEQSLVRERSDAPLARDQVKGLFDAGSGEEVTGVSGGHWE